MIDKSTYKPMLEDGVWKFPIGPGLQRNAQRYGELREKEGRIYSDKVVANLPHVESDHPYKAEFKLREESLEMLNKCLHKHGANNILEIGCGNGWLLANVVRETGAQATGVDIFESELKQAARVYDGLGIDWILGDVFMEILPPANFDVVIIASAAQYFNDINALVERAKDLLKSDGCLFLIDTPWYKGKKQKQATERTFDYYESIGMPWMSGQYHHHSLDALSSHQMKIIYNPYSLLNRVKRCLGYRVLPFHHLAIKKSS